jgi:hypothetical protein
MGGGYGCDLGELPAPPAELAYVAYGLAAAGFAFGLYSLISGRLPIRWDWLKQIWSKRAARLIGVSTLVQALFAVLLGWETAILSRHVVPSPEWLGVLGLPVLIATSALDWWAYRIDRPRPRPTS